MGLAERRHHRQRMRDRARRKLVQWEMRRELYRSEEDRLESLDHRVKRAADNMAKCSCWSCGNPRRHQKDRLTMQEKRASEVQGDDTLG
jgi:hypothetical protein